MKRTGLIIVAILFMASHSFGKIIHIPAELPSIQAGIDASSDGDTVLVSRGLYQENIIFNGKSIVLASQFLLTGDTADISQTIIDGGGYTANRESTVRIMSKVTELTQLVGFTIQNGNLQNRVDEASGAGIRVTSGSPKIRHCIIENNITDRNGGGVYIGTGKRAELFNCIIRNNVAEDHGGGVCIQGKRARVNNCIITKNRCTAGWGAGITLFGCDSVVIANSLISNNNDGYANIGIYVQGGNCISIQNTIVGHEYGIYYYAVGESVHGEVINTILENEYDMLFSEIIVPSEINIYNSMLDTSFIMYNDQGSYVEGLIDVVVNLTDVLSEDPGFVDASAGNYRLSNSSAAIGTGISVSPIPPISLPDNDLENNPRPVPLISNPDMGAYESVLGTPEISFDSIICQGDTLDVEYKGVLSDDITLEWEFPGASFTDLSDVSNPRATWDGTGIKSFSLTVKDLGVVVDYQQDSVHIYNIPTADFGLDKLSLCNPDTLTVIYTGSGSPEALYQWEFGDGILLTGSGQGPYKVIWVSPGNKHIGLRLEENGCSSEESSGKVSVYQPSSDFSIPDAVCGLDSAEVVFTGVASDSVVYDWDFGTASMISGSGAGPYLVKWEDYGSKEVSLTINDNGCISGLTSHSIQYNPVPTAAISVSSTKICSNGTANITYVGSAGPSAEYQWEFDNGTIITGSGSGPYEVYWDIPGQKNVFLEVTENQCSSNTNAGVMVNQATQSLSICMVGVDSFNHNMIVWEQPMNHTFDSVYIYKESSQKDIYFRIGSQPADRMSVFTDLNSNPAQNSSRYKIAVYDTCGYETPLSDYHKTLHLTVSKGIKQSFNLIWDKYEGFEVSTYNIYRGRSNGTLEKIDEQSSNNFTYTDLDPPSASVYYQIEVVNPNNCSVSNLKSTQDYYSSSRSNIVNTELISSTPDLSIPEIQVWPNPASFEVYIKLNDFSAGGEAAILSLEGKALMVENLNKPVSQIDISNLKAGIYLIRIACEDTRVIRKLIKY